MEEIKEANLTVKIIDGARVAFYDNDDFLNIMCFLVQGKTDFILD